MLVTQAQTLISQLGRRDGLQKHVKQLKDFQERERRIKDAVQRLRPLVESWRAMNAAGITDLTVDQQAAALLQTVEEIQTEFERDAAWLIDRRFPAKVFNDRMENLTKALETGLLEAWQRFAAAKTPETRPETLDLLGKVEAFKPTVRTIRESATAITQSRERLPANKDDIIRFETQVRRLGQAWDTLDAQDISTDVLAFLKAAATTGASLKMLTVDVQQWLSQKGMDSAFHIRMAP